MGKIFSDIFKGSFFKGDMGVWMIFLFLCLISVVEVYSASSSLTYGGGHHWDPMIQQVIFIIAGVIVVLIVHRIPCRFFMLLPIMLIPLSIVLLAYTSFFTSGQINGANRWISIGFFSFQPSELGKAALITTVAVILSKMQAEKIVVDRKGRQKKITGAFKGGDGKAFWIIMIFTFIICGLIFTENLSTAGILFIVVYVMMIIGKIPAKYLVRLALSIVALLLAASLFVFVTPDDTLNKIPKMHRATTWKHRILDKAEDVNNESGDYNVADNLQVAHSQIAIATSNISGKGPGNSVERDFLSHAESDFIFSIIVEELGVFGALFVMMLYIMLLMRCYKIAGKCQRCFPAYLVLGIAIMIVLQAVINMGVASGVLPVTGQPLPVISRGGSSLLINCAYFGMILSVSRYAEKISNPDANVEQLATKNESDEYFSQENMS